MDRPSRLRRNEDFQRVRREGRSYSSPWLVLVVAPNGLDHTRFGFAVGKRIGKAVARNRAKRRLREAVRRQQPQVAPGWDVVLIARESMADVPFAELAQAVAQLLRRARVLKTVDQEPRHEDHRSGPD